MPNPRGSNGYGQKFVEEISGDWGGKAYVDIMNGVDMLAALPYVDGTRIGAAGGSYGGYMVDWILGHTDRFKALVSHAGVYDLKSMYGATEELWFPEWEFKGNPWDNPELYQKWSPDNFVKNFKTPTLVMHGELDFRVPINQGLRALHRAAAPRHPVEDALLPRRRPLGAEAAELEALVPDGGRLVRSVVEDRKRGISAHSASIDG